MRSAPKGALERRFAPLSGGEDRAPLIQDGIQFRLLRVVIEKKGGHLRKRHVDLVASGLVDHQELSHVCPLQLLVGF